jgi:leucyl aminopeptidase (aminopeptidase T)
MTCRPTAAFLAAAIASAMLAACQPSAPAGDAAIAPAATAADETAPDSGAFSAAPTDLEQLAERLVTQSAAVKEGEIVFISGRQQDAELLENIAVHVRKRGAWPMIGYSSDRLAKRTFFDVPEQYDAQTDRVGAELAKVVDVTISLGNATSENLFEGADPQRMAARGRANEPVAKAFMENNVRTVDVGNDFYPTPWRAERYGMELQELANTFWNGVNIDYSELQSRGEQVKAALASGNEMHITNPNGTDLKVRVQGRPVLVSDGIISDDDIKQGGPALSVYLPAGEVFTTPVPGTAEGKVVHTRTFYRGKQVDDLTLTINGGKVTDMTGSGPGYADLRAEYDAVEDPRKDLFGFIDIGINPNVALPAGSAVGTWVPAGAVTVGTGSNTWAGGDNSVPYGMTVFLPGSTVMLDGNAIVENGQLKL